MEDNKKINSKCVGAVSSALDFKCRLRDYVEDIGGSTYWYRTVYGIDLGTVVSNEGVAFFSLVRIAEMYGLEFVLREKGERYEVQEVEGGKVYKRNYYPRLELFVPDDDVYNFSVTFLERLGSTTEEFIFKIIIQVYKSCIYDRMRDSTRKKLKRSLRRAIYNPDQAHRLNLHKNQPLI